MAIGRVVFALRKENMRINPKFNQPNEVVIAPSFISALSFAEAKFVHNKGEISCRWEMDEQKGYRLEVAIPDGVEAKLRLPDGYESDENELPAGKRIILVRKV